MWVQCGILLVPQRMLGAINEPAFTSLKKKQKKQIVVFSQSDFSDRKGSLFFFLCMMKLCKQDNTCFIQVVLSHADKKEKVSTCACAEMLSDKNIFWFHCFGCFFVLFCFLCRLHRFGLVDTGLYSAGGSPGFAFGHISVASGSSSSRRHFYNCTFDYFSESANALHWENYFAQTVFVGFIS